MATIRTCDVCEREVKFFKDEATITVDVKTARVNIRFAAKTQGPKAVDFCEDCLIKTAERAVEIYKGLPEPPKPKNVLLVTEDYGTCKYCGAPYSCRRPLLLPSLPRAGGK